jgi:hypothetical protein
MFGKLSCFVCISAWENDKILIFFQKMLRQKLYKSCMNKFLLENKEVFQRFFDCAQGGQIKNSKFRKFFSKSENHQKFFSKNQKQIRKNNFLQINVYHVVILAFTTLLELCSLILLHFRKCFTRKKSNGINIALS